MPSPKNENGFLNVLVNVLIPVVILNKLSVVLGPLNALVLALAFPVGYGAWDFSRNRKFNWLSFLGLLNVSATGGLALSGRGEIWFSVKEALFPTLIGVFVLASAFSNTPFVATLVLNPKFIALDRVSERLKALGHESDFQSHLRRATYMLAGCFGVSAVLNFALAQAVFLPMDPVLDATARAVVLNGQIAKMTGYSLIVIMVPSMAMLGFIFWFLLNGLRKFTGLPIDAILKG